MNFSPGSGTYGDQKKKRKITRAFIKISSWFLLRGIRGNEIDAIDFCISQLKGNSFFSKKADLEKKLLRGELTYCFLLKEKEKENDKDFSISVIAAMEQNQRCRFAMKRLLNIWLFKHAKKVNEEDVFTMSPIIEPVYILQSNRTIYAFEAKMISKDMHSKLTHSEGQIPTPQIPRNPFTNEPFTIPQIYSLHRQCLRYGHSKWSLSCLLECGCDIDMYLRLHRLSLRKAAIQQLYKTREGVHFTDIVLDFIAEVHSEYEFYFREKTFTLSLRNEKDTPYMLAWISLSYEYALAEIQCLEQEQILIFKRAKELCY